MVDWKEEGINKLNPMNLLELLTRTRLQVFTYEQGTMAKVTYPNGMGS